MLKIYQYPGFHDRKTNDGTSAFCQAEGINEEYFRYCIGQGLKKETKAGTKRTLKIMAAIVGAIVVIVFALSLKMNSDLRNLAFSETRMDHIPDGWYLGKAETTFTKAEVEVAVRDHRIISISILKHDNGFGEKAEMIVEEMIRMNTHEVDVVSGATASSIVIRCAVSDALAKGSTQ